MGLVFGKALFEMARLGYSAFGVFALFFEPTLDFTLLDLQAAFENPLECRSFLCNQLTVVSVHEEEFFVLLNQGIAFFEDWKF